LIELRRIRRTIIERMAGAIRGFYPLASSLVSITHHIITGDELENQPLPVANVASAYAKLILGIEKVDAQA
jgi:hypothetical protein